MESRHDLIVSSRLNVVRDDPESKLYVIADFSTRVFAEQSEDPEGNAFPLFKEFSTLHLVDSLR
jgi:hypothetical protein